MNLIPRGTIFWVIAQGLYFPAHLRLQRPDTSDETENPRFALGKDRLLEKRRRFAHRLLEKRRRFGHRLLEKRRSFGHRLLEKRRRFGHRLLEKRRSFGHRLLETNAAPNHIQMSTSPDHKWSTQPDHKWSTQPDHTRSTQAGHTWSTQPNHKWSTQPAHGVPARTARELSPALLPGNPETDMKRSPRKQKSVTSRKKHTFQSPVPVCFQTFLKFVASTQAHDNLKETSIRRKGKIVQHTI